MNKVPKYSKNVLLPLLQQDSLRNFSTQTLSHKFYYEILRIQSLTKSVNTFLNFKFSNFLDLIFLRASDLYYDYFFGVVTPCSPPGVLVRPISAIFYRANVFSKSI